MTCTWRSCACRSTAQVSAGAATARGAASPPSPCGHPGPGPHGSWRWGSAGRGGGEHRAKGSCRCGIRGSPSLPSPCLHPWPGATSPCRDHATWSNVAQSLWSRSSAGGCQQLPPAATLKNQSDVFPGHQLAKQVIKQESVLIIQH